MPRFSLFRSDRPVALFGQVPKKSAQMKPKTCPRHKYKMTGTNFGNGNSGGLLNLRGLRDTGKPALPLARQGGGPGLTIIKIFVSNRWECLDPLQSGLSKFAGFPGPARYCPS